MSICPNCNTENPDGAKFCMNCGFNIKNQNLLKDSVKYSLNPNGTLEDFQSDLDVLHNFSKDTTEFLNNIQLSVSDDGDIDSKINNEINKLKNELDDQKQELNKQLKVLNSDLITITFVKEDTQSPHFTFTIDIDEEQLNQYLEYYKSEHDNLEVDNKSTNLSNETYDNELHTLCPICKYCELIENTRKVSLGLRTKNTLDCPHCGAIFEKKRDKYKFLDIQDKNNHIWNKYKHETLTGREWIQIGNGGLSDLDQKEADVTLFLTELQEGQTNIESADQSPVILKKNENLSLILNNISLFEPRAVRKTVGTYGGPTIRLSKGVSFRVGGVSAKSESHDELKKIDQGSIILTNRRLIFLGSKRTTNIDLKKIIAIDAYKDGIVSQRENKQKTEHFSGTDKNIININVNNRQHTLKVNGAVLKAAIVGKIVQL